MVIARCNFFGRLGSQATHSHSSSIQLQPLSAFVAFYPRAAAWAEAAVLYWSNYPCEIEGAVILDRHKYLLDFIIVNMVHWSHNTPIFSASWLDKFESTCEIRLHDMVMHHLIKIVCQRSLLLRKTKQGFNFQTTELSTSIDQRSLHQVTTTENKLFQNTWTRMGTENPEFIAVHVVVHPEIWTGQVEQRNKNFSLRMCAVWCRRIKLVKDAYLT